MNMASAPLARLRVMYLVFIKGDFDAKYSNTVIRVNIASMIPNFCVFAIYIPDQYFYIPGLVLRLLLLMAIIEMMYYCFRLRKTKLLRDQYGDLLSACGLSLIAVVNVASALVNLDHSALAIDQFNAVMVVVWVLNGELIGPTVYQTFVEFLQRNNRMKYNNGNVSFQINKRNERTGLQTIIDDDRLYPALLAMAWERYCEGNILFLHDGLRLCESLKACQAKANGQKQNSDPISFSIDIGQSQASTFEPAVPMTRSDWSSTAIYKKQLTTEKRSAHTAQRLYPRSAPQVCPRSYAKLCHRACDAPTPVNLTSAQISALQQARSLECLKKSDTDIILNVLVLSLADVQMLFEASGVLATFEQSEARAMILGEREAVIRLGIETERLEDVESIPD
ncbi:hypothetical protein SARC_13433 [Sphaeroforma arctica JP610]|uniref:Uncharacterized protein n=1 Tax=Sphaeroforma arctica JP610 TaxID=667725 RepID=A0A0L0FB96_9EUKA|nr:hypothetical protein SARC_13433 [Sphaeroforma arctica JP610]KNC74009.1 hypothetical protein SARC_13433 [Sphaeroforma arctica JP610]|eukprot:XP_014147911.1 hypothetical protein SARC_13433 [Sphaeroforma arctica JP610]